MAGSAPKSGATRADSEAPPIGTFGTITGVDDIGTIHVSWDTGGSLGIAYGEDFCRRID